MTVCSETIKIVAVRSLWVYAFLFNMIMFALFVPVLHAQDWGLVRCVDSKVNVRAGRSTDSAVVCQLNAGDPVKVDFLEGSWWAVFGMYETERSQDNAIGYIYAPLLKPVSKKNMKVWGSQPEKKE